MTSEENKKVENETLNSNVQLEEGLNLNVQPEEGLNSNEKSVKESLNANEHPEKDDDGELDELLDNVLEDFKKSPNLSATAKAQTEDLSEKKDFPGGNLAFGDSAKWCEEFFQPNSAALEEAIQTILNDDPELAEGVKKMAELTAKATNGQVTDSDINALTQDFLNSLTQIDDEASAKEYNHTPDVNHVEITQYISAIRGSSDFHSKPCQGDIAAVPEELSKMFEKLKNSVAPNEPGSIPEVASAMQTIMQMLLSKDLLYPALQDVAEKYPDWLAENRAHLEAEKYEAYNKQYHIIKEICNEFEAEPTDNSEDSPRYEKILELMQKMQECGQPPADLIGDMGNCTKFDCQNIQGLQAMCPDGNSQCAVM